MSRVSKNQVVQSCCITWRRIFKSSHGAKLGTWLTCGKPNYRISAVVWFEGWDFTLRFFNPKGSAVKKFRLTSVKKYPNCLLLCFPTYPKPTDLVFYLGRFFRFLFRLGSSGSSTAEEEAGGANVVLAERDPKSEYPFGNLQFLGLLLYHFGTSSTGPSFSASGFGSGISGSFSVVGQTPTTSSVAGLWCSSAMNK